jgi:class 3 adenylate cyclase
MEMLNSAAADAAGANAYLARFVPDHRRQLLRSRSAGKPVSRTLAAVVLYVDIVGFTALTGQMTQNLAVGAEAVAEGVNAVLTGIAAIAGRYGGEVMHFAGDAAWIGWFGEDATDLPRACHLAAAAAIAVRSATRSWEVGGHPVALRASIGAGTLQQLELGGYHDRWCGLLRGPAIDDAVAADGFGAAGTVVASPTVWQHLKDVSEAARLPKGYVRIEGVGPVQAAVEPSIEIHAGDEGAAIPEMLVHRARGGEPTQWSGEFRTCHIVFGRLAADTDIARLHRAVGEIQRVLDRTNGSLYQLLSDEKGLAVIAAYGLPPRASGTDGARALEATVQLSEALDALGMGAHFGIAAGRVFCTTYGSDNQLQFALVGPALNRAARLPDGTRAVIADAAIVEAELPATLTAAELPPKILKGFADPVSVFAITRRAGQGAGPIAGDAASLVGRASELARGLERLAGVAEGQGAFLLIEGDPGAGKSMFASSLLAAAAAQSLPTARGAAEEIERATEYRPWRQALSSILADVVGPDDRLSDAALADLGDNRPYAGLLSRLLDLQPLSGVAETRLTDEARATLVREMAVDLLAARSRQGPFVLLLEDLHWFDSPSLALLDAVLEAHLPILVVATSRGDERSRDLVAGPGRDRIVLGGLEPEQSVGLLAQTCNAVTVDDALAARVHDITSGNPLFVTQLGRFLLDHGHVQVIHGQLVAANERLSLQRAFETHGVPSTLEGVVMARLDALPVADGETARAASVLGGTFGRDDLAALIGGDPELSSLIAAGILVSHDTDTVDFRHAILRDVAYSTLSLTDRRRLHGAAARLMAAKPEAAAGQLDAVLAHHLEQAGDIEAAVEHGRRAGASLLRGNANREALSQFVHGLELSGALAQDRRSALRETQIDLELGAGEAAQRLSLYDEAVRHKDTALAALGGAIPAGAAAVPALLREVAVQVVRRRVPWLIGDRRPRREDLRLSAETAELVEVYFYRGESLRSLYAALRALNLAEGGGDTPQLARGFGIVGTIAGFARLSGVARAYGERALDVLSRIDDPGASWWVPLVVGVSRLSAGDLATASHLMDMTAAAAERIRDRRHWRDAIGNQSIISGLRGDWNGGLALSQHYGATALEDRDIRYIVGAAREQAYFLFQLGRLDDAEQCLTALRTEIERGLKAEEAASRQDLHAIAAAIALARGDTSTARREAEAGYSILIEHRGGSSFPNMFWSISLLFDAFLQLASPGPRHDDDRAKAWTLVRALDKHAASHLIGRPAAWRAHGLYEQTFGWAARAGRWFDRAAASARALGMAYTAEPALAKGPESPLARLIPSWVRRGCSSR